VGGLGRFGRYTHAGFSGVCKRKAESSDWVTTESLGNALRTSRFQYGFSAGSEAANPPLQRSVTTQPQNLAQRTRTFGSRRTVLFRPGTRLRVPIQGRNRETARDFGVHDRRVACKETFLNPQTKFPQRRYTRTEFLPKTLWRDVI